MSSLLSNDTLDDIDGERERERDSVTEREGERERVRGRDDGVATGESDGRPVKKAKRRDETEDGEREREKKEESEVRDVAAAGDERLHLGPRCEYLRRWFDERPSIERSHLSLLLSLSPAHLTTKCAEVTRWSGEIKRREVRERERVERLGVLRRGGAWGGTEQAESK